MPIDDLLTEVIDSCKLTGACPEKAAEIYSENICIYWNLKRYQRDMGCTGEEYAVSFMRDYIWFGDEDI